MQKTVLDSYPTHKSWVKYPTACRYAFLFILFLTYFLCNKFHASTFLLNTLLYPAMLVLYSFVFLDENIFACLSQTLLFISIKSTLPGLFTGTTELLDNSTFSPLSSVVSFCASLFGISEYGETSFAYDITSRLLPSLTMIIFYFYLTHFAVKGKEKFPFSYWMTLCFTSLFSIVWGFCSYPEYFAVEYATLIRCTVSLGLLIINLMVYYLFYRITTQYKENLELKVLQQRISLDNASNEEMNHLYLSLRQVRHDLLNHIGIMDSLLKDKHYQELENYFASIQQNEYRTLHYLETGNIAVNALLNRKVQAIQELEIPIHAKVLIPPQSNIDDTDLCAILANLLDNASEAVHALHHGSIELSVGPHTGYLVIQSTNTIEEDPLKSNPLLHSTKGNSPFHGLGLKIVKNIVKKYDGMISIDTKDYKFCVKIMLPFTEREQKVS